MIKYLMELQHGLEREVSGYISIHHKEWLAIVAVLYEVSGERKGTGSVHGSCLVRERKFDSESVSVAAKFLLEHVGHVASAYVNNW